MNEGYNQWKNKPTGVQGGSVEPIRVTSLDSALDDSSIISSTGYIADTEGIAVSSLACRKRSRSRPYSSVKAHKTKGAASSKRRFRCRGCKRKSNTRTCHCSWIERIYSNTPFKFPVTAEINSFEDLSIYKAAPTYEYEGIPANKKWRLPLAPAMPNSRIANRESSSEERSYSNEEEEFSAMFGTLSSLLQDYHEVQALYRTYATQGLIEANIY